MQMIIITFKIFWIFSELPEEIMSMGKKIKYPKIGICGLSCRFCPHYQSDCESKCYGCKSKERISIGCPFINCAIKRKNIEFCMDCNESLNCELWRKHRESGKKSDSFVCYQELESNISFIQKYGIDKFNKIQRDKEKILIEMLKELSMKEDAAKNYR
jgi:hypothetical protein